MKEQGDNRSAATLAAIKKPVSSAYHTTTKWSRRKKLLSTAVFVAAALFSFKSYAQFAGGAGSQSDPYQIATAAQLDSVRHYLDSSFVLVKDISLNVAPYNTGTGWVPIGGAYIPFTGTFNGRGFTIDSLFISRVEPSNDAGLFSYANGATIDSVGLTNVHVKGNGNVGGLAAWVGVTTIRNSYVTGNVTGKDRVGGLVGRISYSTVATSYSTANVTGTDGASATGGLVGLNDGSSTITNSYATGNVTGQADAQNTGGLVGISDNASTIANSYAVGRVSGSQAVGGFLGQYISSTLTANYWDTLTSTQPRGIGDSTSAGVVGQRTAAMKNKSTFSTWDFSESGIWNIDSSTSYPWLRSNPQIPRPGANDPSCPAPEIKTQFDTACITYTWIDGLTYTRSTDAPQHKIKASNGCDSVIVKLNLTIKSIDTRITFQVVLGGGGGGSQNSLTADGNSLIAADNGTGASYQWLDCDSSKQPISGATSRVFTPSREGSYAVAIVKGTCKDTSDCKQLGPSALLENDFDRALRIYPNPTEGDITIDLGARQAFVELTLTAASGKQIARATYTDTEEVVYTLPQPAGIYFVTLTAASKRAVIRLVKE